MKKRLTLFAAATAALMAACTPEQNCVIEGTIDSLKKDNSTVKIDTLVIGNLTRLGIAAIDTAIVKDGKFKFDVNPNGKGEMVQIMPIVGGELAMAYSVIIEPGARFSMNIPQSPEEQPTFSGSKSNTEMAVLDKMVFELNLMANKYIEITQNPMISEEEREKANHKLDSLSELVITSYVETIRHNIPSALSDILFGLVDQAISDSIRADIIIAMEQAGCTDMPNYTRIKTHMELDAQTAPGKPFTDFTQADKNGDQIHLADIVSANKLTLVDFWASWCGPCRAEMPYVVKAYELYHDKGLEIVGVSLDENREAWLKAVDALGMKWLQVSDLQGWNNVAARAYVVESIPSCFLIGQDGVIVAKNLRGDELAKKIGEILE